MTDVAYGESSLQKLPALCAAKGWKRVFLVCGKSSFEASGANIVLPALEKQAAVLRWSDFEPNTDSADLWRGLALLRDFAPDAVIAVGGGSAMDMAKLLCAYPDIAGKSALLSTIRSGAKIEKRSFGLCLIPTTSGSGSEATHFAVVYDGVEKFSVGGPALYADAVILDPVLTLSGSAYQRATSGIDAVCQSVESLWAAGGTDASRRNARHALSLLLKHIEPFVNKPATKDARGMTLGSHLAGRAIDISKTTAAHALSYTITKRHGVSHGHAVALTLGSFIEAHAETPHMRAITQAFNAATAAEAAEKFRKLLSSIGLQPCLSAAGITSPEALEKIVASVNLERLANNPVRFSPEQMTQMLKKAG